MITKIKQVNLSILKFKDLVNNIKNITISEIDAKKDLNALNKIKNVEIIKYKKCIPGHQKLLNLFNDLSDTILTDKTLESQENEYEKVESRKEENEKVENRKKENKKLESRKEENENGDYENKYENEDEDDYYENENEYENENKDEDETMS